MKKNEKKEGKSRLKKRTVKFKKYKEKKER